MCESVGASEIIPPPNILSTVKSLERKEVETEETSTKSQVKRHRKEIYRVLELLWAVQEGAWKRERSGADELRDDQEL